MGRAVREFARVSNRLVVVEDTLYSSPDVEAAEKLRDPTHVRNLVGGGLAWRVRGRGASKSTTSSTSGKTHALDDWLARTECTGADADRVRELLADVTDDDGATWHDTKIILRGVKGVA